MPWWGWALTVLAANSAVWFVLDYRAGTHRRHYSDGCAKPFFDRAHRADGSPKHIFPRRGDGEVEDLEHLMYGHRSGSDQVSR